MGIKKSLAWTTPMVTAAAAIGSVATQDGMESRWYKSLKKPAIQPPAVVFPIAWTSLYAAIAGSAATVDAELGARPTKEAARTRRNFRIALLINMILNGGWSWVFFRWHKLPQATLFAGILALSSADLTRRAAAVKSGAGAAMAPYAAWTAFATVLTGAVWRKNPKK
ncbi:TspO/MBR family protein [Enemella sp. A6]|uniref:TspO/MBR family protein n=1 Tax=Enemella sp. A6 TaxID=3440152 RepID=UPI003EBEF611